MSAPAAVLALDQGSHASRACLYDARGQLVAQHSLPVATRHPGEDRVEQDAEELADTLQRSADAVLAGWGGEVVAAGLATQRSTIVCVRRATLAPLSAAISWQDRRHHAWLATLAPLADAIRARTGLPLSPHYGASKMRWCLDHLAAVRAAADAGDLALLPLASYLCARLTSGDARLACGGANLEVGEARVDPANASRTLLFDSARFDWSPELMEIFGIDARWLPRCVPTAGPASSAAGFGVLRAGGRNIPLAACTGDQSAVPFSEDAIDAGAAYLNLGTGAFVQRPLAVRPQRSAPLIAGVLADCAGERWHCLEGTVNGAGAAVQWYAEQQGCNVDSLWPALDTLAADAELPVFINGIGGLGSPWWRPQPRSGFADDVSPALLPGFAAVLESIVFMLARNLGWIESLGGPLPRLRVGGGLARSAWLCQRLADVTGKPVLRLDEEATSRGAARLAAPGFCANWIGDAGRAIEPAAKLSPALAARRRRFDALIDAT